MKQANSSQGKAPNFLKQKQKTATNFRFLMGCRNIVIIR